VLDADLPHLAGLRVDEPVGVDPPVQRGLEVTVTNDLADEPDFIVGD
jgi:hypothetical protein